MFDDAAITQNNMVIGFIYYLFFLKTLYRIDFKIRITSR